MGTFVFRPHHRTVSLRRLNGDQVSLEHRQETRYIGRWSTSPALGDWRRHRGRRMRLIGSFLNRSRIRMGPSGLARRTMITSSRWQDCSGSGPVKKVVRCNIQGILERVSRGERES